MSELTQEDVVQYLCNLSVMQIISLTKDLEQLWGVEAVPQMVQQAPTLVTDAPVAAQTEFSVVLNTVAADKKISVIKTVRELLGLSLMDSKAILDALPKTIKEGLTKDEAEELKRKLTEAGGMSEVK